MGILYSQASFKNSRIASRKPTTQATTIEVTVDPGDVVKVLDLDLTRTYSTIFNTSKSDTLRYAYSNLPTIDIDGFPLFPTMAADLENPQEVWVKNQGTNPILVQIDYGQG